MMFSATSKASSNSHQSMQSINLQQNLHHLGNISANVGLGSGASTILPSLGGGQTQSHHHTGHHHHSGSAMQQQNVRLIMQNLIQIIQNL